MRHEIKYILPATLIPVLKSQFEGYLKPDPFASRMPDSIYTVRSIYYETKAFDFYWEKMEGLKNRKKFRIRGYNEQDDSAIVFLEIKKKFNGKIKKVRVPLSFADSRKLVEDGDVDKWLAEGMVPESRRKDAMAFLYHFYKHQLKTVVGVIYERLPYEAIEGTKDNNLRVTLDMNLRGVAYPSLDKLFDENKAVPVMPGKFILEVKYNQTLPRWLARVLHQLNIRRQAASKYCMCIDAHPDINPLVNKFGGARLSHAYDKKQMTWKNLHK